jgi:RND family efflux transporter MFP subunit
MKIKRYINLIVGFLFLAVAVVLWAKPSDPQTPPKAVYRTRVLLGSVQADHLQRGARFAGVTQAKNRAVLSFAVPARVAERFVASGSHVAQGAILARLDDREFKNAVSLAQASEAELRTQWEQAKRDHHRIEQLASSHVATVSDLEKVATREAALEASVQAAAARLKEALRLLGETVLRAPFSGTVTGLHIEPGEWALPGQPAMELTGDGDIELLVEVPESVVARLSAGQDVQVLLPFADNRMVPGRIRTVARAAISAGRLFPVRVDLAAEAGLSGGLTAQLLLDLNTEKALSVPLAAVVNPGASQPFVFIYDQGRVSRQPVSVGPILEDRIVVQGAISQGDQVVISGQSQLVDGDEAEVGI